ncbi:COX aromatic rich motif-containing protein [Candidatus Saccharibacteria bacterium]|nr:COX aromatic rich motif-containing protein [Candidatus Saccharibacteria bacterium]
MPKVKSQKLNTRWKLVFMVPLVADFALLLWLFLRGKNIALFNPKGYIAQQQYTLMLWVVYVLLMIGIPSLVLFYYIAWKYRETSPKAVVTLHHRRSKALVPVMWIIPSIFGLIIAGYLIPATHKLAPQKEIEASVDSMRIQVISLRWKWLFLYPEEGVASVNFVQIPENRPVAFEMTADEAPMGSFWIPNLGGQLYTMTKHVNRLNLMAETRGDYPGSTPEITGPGFTGQKFTARVSSQAEFDSWVSATKSSGVVLSMDEYEGLVEPSQNNPKAFYAGYDEDLYATVIAKYNQPGTGHIHTEAKTEEESDEGHSHTH